MRAFRTLAAAMAKGFLRDRMSVFFVVLFPLFFIVIFGLVYAGGGASKQKVIEVGAVPMLDSLPAEARAALAEVIDLQPSDDLAAALESVTKGDVAAAVQQQGDQLQLHYSSADQVASATVRGVFSAFIDQANIAATGATPKYTLTVAQVEDESLKAIQYVTPQMIAYGVSLGATFGAAMTLISWREKKVLRRLRLAPVSTATVVGSRVVVSLVVALVQLALFIGVSLLPVFGLQLHGAWYMSIPLIIAGSLAFLAVGILVGSIAKTAEGGSGLVNLIILPMAFLSGAFIPVEVGPSWIATVSKAMPLGYLVTGLKDVMVRGQGPSAALIPMAVLLGFAIVITFIATRLFRWDST